MVTEHERETGPGDPGAKTPQTESEISATGEALESRTVEIPATSAEVSGTATEGETSQSKPNTHTGTYLNITVI